MVAPAGPRTCRHGEAWVITGTGHHVARGSHQARGGKLFDVAKAYLDERGFTYLVGCVTSGVVSSQAYGAGGQGVLRAERVGDRVRDGRPQGALHAGRHRLPAAQVPA